MKIPYTDINIRWWPDIAASLTKPWPESAALMDLRYQADQTRMGFMRRPMGRGKLAARWGWKPGKVYGLILAPDKWETNLKRDNSFSTENKQKSEAKPLKSQEPSNRKKTDKKQVEQSTLIYNKTTKQTELTIKSVWDSILEIKGGRKLKLSKSRATALRARLAENTSEDILSVVKWWRDSPHTRAVYLRTNGYGIDTLLSGKKFSEYLDMTEALCVVSPKSKGFASSLLEGFLSDIDTSNVIPFETNNQPQAIEAEYEEK